MNRGSDIDIVARLPVVTASMRPRFMNRGSITFPSGVRSSF